MRDCWSTSDEDRVLWGGRGVVGFLCFFFAGFLWGEVFFFVFVFFVEERGSGFCCGVFVVGFVFVCVFVCFLWLFFFCVFLLDGFECFFFG